MTQDKKILFLLQDFPYPPSNGINRKVYSLLSSLAVRGWRCDVLCFGGTDAEARIPAFEAALPGVRVLAVVPPVCGAAGVLRRLLSLLRGLPPSLGTYNSERFRQVLREAAKTGKYKAAHYDVINMAQYLPWGPRVPSVLSSNDAISRFYQGMITESSGFLRRSYLRLSMSRIVRFEKNVYPLFDRVHVVSREDAAYLKRISPGLRIEVIPLGAEIGSSDVATPCVVKKGGPVRVVFTGNLDIPGIANGLFEFLEHDYPGLIARAPTFEFHVLGPRASAADEQRIRGFPRLKYFKWVEDYHKFLEEADILLSLDKSGTGIKTRVLDALALGKTVVGTSVAFGGIAVENGKHCLVCNGSRQVAEALERLLLEPALRETIGLAAHELMRTKYSLAVVGDEWDKLYKSLSAAASQGEGEGERSGFPAGSAVAGPQGPFALVRFLAVAVVLGFLTSVAFPYYFKAVEKALARDAFYQGEIVNEAYLKYKATHHKRLYGTLSDATNTETCDLNGSSICILIHGGYLQRRAWSALPYTYSVEKSCPKRTTACVRRISGTGVYAYWGYDYNSSGNSVPVGNAPTFTSGTRGK